MRAFWIFNSSMLSFIMVMLRLHINSKQNFENTNQKTPKAVAVANVLYYVWTVIFSFIVMLIRFRISNNKNQECKPGNPEACDRRERSAQNQIRSYKLFKRLIVNQKRTWSFQFRALRPGIVCTLYINAFQSSHRQKTNTPTVTLYITRLNSALKYRPPENPGGFGRVKLSVKSNTVEIIPGKTIGKHKPATNKKQAWKFRRPRLLNRCDVARE